MNKISQKMRQRREMRELRQAIDRANTPSMRTELMTIARRWDY